MQWWGELKKGRYVYYHCTGYKGKCNEPYVREEVIADKFSLILGRLSFADEVLQWVSTALRESHTDQKKEHESAIARLQAECDRIQNRIHAMYVDKLDGRIDRSFYVQMSEQWRAEQEKLMQEITLHQAADQCYLDEGVRLLELAQTSQRLFAKQEPREQRRLLNFVLSNSTWKSGELSVVFRQPFDLIAETTATGSDGDDSGGGNPPGCPAWWGRQDSNLRSHKAADLQSAPFATRDTPPFQRRAIRFPLRRRNGPWRREDRGSPFKGGAAGRVYGGKPPLKSTKAVP